MTHKCAVKHCNEEISTSFLMCPAHWRKVPKNLQRDVWRTYQNGQEKTDGPAPTMEYYTAANAAAKFIEERELGMFA